MSRNRKVREVRRKDRQLKRITAKLTMLFVIVVSLFVGNVLNIATAKSSKDVDYTVVIVRSGDTLWEIAKDNVDNKDPREVIYDIKKLNRDLNLDVIRVGQQIKIPVYR